MKLTFPSTRLCRLPLLAVVLSATCLHGQTSAQLEVQEANTALQIAQAKVQTLEGKLSRAKEQVNSLGEALASATAVGKQDKESYEKLRLQLEGLGVAALNGSSTELQQRLLASLSDLRILDQQKRQLADALMSLSESSLALAKVSPNASEEIQQNLNKSLSAAEKAIAATQPANAGAEGDLKNAKVVSLKDELGIAILNVGSKQGVHAGMPITIYRQDKPVARAMVAEVRTMICGAIVQELMNEKDAVRVGDVGKVDTSKS